MSPTSLVHQVAWTPAVLSEKPVELRKVIFLADDKTENVNLSSYTKTATNEGLEIVIVNDASELDPELVTGNIVVHIPLLSGDRNGIYNAVTKSCASLVAAAQMMQKFSQSPCPSGMHASYKLISVTNMDSSVNDLGFAPLRGLARVLKAEIPEIFSGLFEQDREGFPLSAIRNACGFDVIKIRDGVPQIGLLQSVPQDCIEEKELRLRPDGTYLITGGTRGMGIEIATWMCERGARSLLLVSRRGLSSNMNLDEKEKDPDHDKLASRIIELKARGTQVHILGIDLGQPGADSILGQAIQDLNLLPVKGVFHGAGIAGYHTLQTCTASDIADVLAPKVVGALNLDTLFPPGQLDFCFFASSVGQLVGFPGQLSYAPVNAFLDELATYRRKQGDNCTSIQWGSWRDVGLMARSKSATRMINKGMQSTGIAAMTKEEALLALERITFLETDNVAVVRVLELQPDEPSRHPILENVTPRAEPQTSGFDKYPEHSIAVVGMACRTAAGDTLEDFWEVIREGRSMAREMDINRFPDAPKGKLWGNFLSEIDSFDHQFFKKSKREASALDPHQRVLLQTTYHALESAGCFGGGKRQKPESYDKTKNEDTTGCFIGMNAPDYALNLACHSPSPYAALGMLRSFVSGRLSHYFGWTGPSHVVDTACSSAMVAIHQACRAIQAGECTRAVAGGINLITNTVLSEALRAGGFTNHTGACKTFDALADGYCRGEAVGVVVLKPLAKALKDGDDIQGVLLATANNQNVNYTTITNTVLESQVALYREVLARAGVSPRAVSYVEAHGTGTRAGDPVEVAAIRQALGMTAKDRTHPLHIGATKPNVGHAEGASGVVSLIKVLLMLKHGKIPPQAQFQTLNPNIAPLEPDGLAISQSLQSWDDNWRLALVNNAGASGNNAFAVLAPAPMPSRIEMPRLNSAKAAWPIFISAASRESLVAYCAKLEDQIRNGWFAPETVPHVAFTLATKQNRQLKHTFCTKATSFEDLKAQLSVPDKHVAASSKPKPIILMFSGQNGNVVPGTQAMYDGSALFRKYLHECENVMQSLGLPSLLPATLQGIGGDADLLIRHAAMIAIQYACGMAWIDSGITPDAVCGHSLGEWTAMAVSGAISLEDCMRLVTGAHLGFFQREHAETRLDIACYNGPNNYVAAGSTSGIEKLESYLKHKKESGEKVRYKVMRGMHAYHCVLVDSILNESGDLCDAIKYQDTIFPFETCHEGPWNVPGGDIIARNTRGSVYFTQAISRIVSRLGPCTFLEAGIGGPIVPMTRNALLQSQSQHQFIAVSAKDPLRSLAEATVSLWKDGQSNLQFWPFHREERAAYVSVSLPSYQFEQSKHWVKYTGLASKSESTDEQGNQQPATCPHCLKNTSDFPYIALDRSGGNGTVQFVFKVDIRSRRYQDLVSGHVVVGSPICPAGMYLELASHALLLLPDAANPSTSWKITSDKLKIKMPLGLDTQREVKLSLTSQGRGTWEFELSSTKGKGKSNSHGAGIIRLQQKVHDGIDGNSDDREKWDRISYLLDEDEETESLRGTMVYKVFGTMAKYSPAYKGIKYLVGKGSEGAGEIKMPVQDSGAIATSPNSKIADPVLMDNFLQVAGAFVHSMRGIEGDGDADMACICTGMGRVTPLSELQGSGRYRVYVKVLQEDENQVLLDVSAFDKETRKMIWSAESLSFARVPRKTLGKVVAAASPANVAENLTELPAATVLPPPTPNKSPEFSSEKDVSEPLQVERKGSSVDVFGGVQVLLSESLDVGISEVTKEASLADLGADSLVGSEILALVTAKFDIEIATDIFATVTDVTSLCKLISNQLRIGFTKPNKVENIGDSKPVSSNQIPNDPPPTWQKTIFEILSRSLGLDVSDIEMDSRMEDLGVDSLVEAEIVSNLNGAFNLSTSPSDFASVENVESLCNFFAVTLGIAQINGQSSSASHDSPLSPISSASTLSNSDEDSTGPRDGEKRIPSQSDTLLLWKSFQQARWGFDGHARDNNLTGFWDNVYPQQLASVAAFIAEAFEKLNCPIRTFNQGERLPELQETLPQWYREVPRLWEILEEAGIVEKAGGVFVRGSAPLEENTGDQLTVKLIADFPQYKSSHGLFHLIGPHLAECLTGRTDPVSLLFGNEQGRSLLADYYAHAPDLNAATKVLCDFFSAAIQARSSGSSGEALQILELGAGTGGTTKHLVPALQATGLPFTYTFSEISASLLARARRTTFKGIMGVDFRKLNIEEDPPRSFWDLIRPDGCVALVEATQRLAWYELVWGLLDGWWLFNDDRTYPLQSPWDWEREMHSAGFAQVGWSESTSRESRDVRVFCGMVNDVSPSSVTKATSVLLHRASASVNRSAFLIPDGFGSGAVFAALQPLFAPLAELSVYALNSPFLKSIPDLNHQPSLEELAGIYVAEIKRRQPKGPYILAGYSIGGVVTYEAARQLLECQNEIDKLFLIDTICPTLGTCLPDSIVGFLNSIDRVGMVNEAELRQESKGLPITTDHFTLSRQQLMKYRVSKLPGRKIPRVVLISAKEGVDKQSTISRPKVLPEEQNIADWFLDDRPGESSFGWDELLGSGSVDVIRADGNHFSLMMPPNVSVFDMLYRPAVANVLQIHEWGSRFVELLV
ncbi:hypothetical protein N7447_008857 [Penicillium robsamsonii]|uniref:uncharacterized protein n=1 Tax=Penicillium robsamsonii TaxID=1792511 RepID=UPI002547A114|nr:uncharacterized protein N7447_008857 [Penicillium robsamsonii]KAJ5816624.1 hypothetical protein N7447_008857 [Penicillium robsamsonii]